MKEVWVYDLEQFYNFHSAYFINTTTEEEVSFIIHKDLDQRYEYKKFLDEKVSGLVGFNNLHYDSKMLNYFLRNYNNEHLIEDLYYYSQELITSEKPPYDKPLIPQLDLFRVHHYNNVARATSLKWIEFYLRMDNIMDLPISPHSSVQKKQFKEIMYYNRNDVVATKKFYHYTKENGHIKLRNDISNEFGFDATNLSDVSIGERVNSQFYSKYSGLKYSDYKNLRTYRPVIRMIDCIPSYTEFKTGQLKSTLNSLKEKVITGTKNQLNFKIPLGNNVYKLKNGGLHSDDKACIIEPSKDEYLVEADVGSMYPSILIENEAYPKHLGREWLDGYRFVRDDRLKAKVNGNSAKSDALKLALNGGGFGKTNSEFSWMYDPLKWQLIVFQN